MRREEGSAALAAIVMLPLLLVVCAGVIQLGALRVVAARVASAADLATLAAVGDQDDERLLSAGQLRLSADAARVAREYFARNLDPIGAHLAMTPGEVAAGADVAAFAQTPATDPLTTSRYDRPTVRLAARVPIRAPAFGLLLIPTVVTIEVRAVSSPR